MTTPRSIIDDLDHEALNYLAHPDSQRQTAHSLVRRLNDQRVALLNEHVVDATVVDPYDADQLDHAASLLREVSACADGPVGHTAPELVKAADILTMRARGIRVDDQAGRDLMQAETIARSVFNAFASSGPRVLKVFDGQGDPFRQAWIDAVLAGIRAGRTSAQEANHA